MEQTHTEKKAQNFKRPITSNFYAGIDGGASNCRVILKTQDGGLVATANTGPANIFIDPIGARDQMLLALNQACDQAGLDQETRNSLPIVAGLAGAEAPKAVDRFCSLNFPYENLIVVPDTTIALYGAFGDNPGGIVIVGTGLACEWFNGTDRGRIGGWGFQLNDRGSGAWIGQCALRIYVNVFDGLIPKNSISDAVAVHFPGGRSEILEFAYTAMPGDYGRFAKIVWQSLDQGDPLARQIIQEAAGEISNVLATMTRRGVLNFAMLGGMASDLSNWISDEHAGSLVPAKANALEGAAAMAYKAVTGKATG